MPPAIDVLASDGATWLWDEAVSFWNTPTEEKLLLLGGSVVPDLVGVNPAAPAEIGGAIVSDIEKPIGTFFSNMEFVGLAFLLGGAWLYYETNKRSRR